VTSGRIDVVARHCHIAIGLAVSDLQPGSYGCRGRRRGDRSEWRQSSWAGAAGRRTWRVLISSWKITPRARTAHRHPAMEVFEDGFPLHAQALVLAPQTAVFSRQIRTGRRDRRLRIRAPCRSRIPSTKSQFSNVHFSISQPYKCVIRPWGATSRCLGRWPI
jgi:hypothetical protein